MLKKRLAMSMYKLPSVNSPYASWVEMVPWVVLDTLPLPNPKKQKETNTFRKKWGSALGMGCVWIEAFWVESCSEGFFWGVGSNKKDPMTGKYQGPLNVRLGGGFKLVSFNVYYLYLGKWPNVINMFQLGWKLKPPPREVYFRFTVHNG